MTVYRVRFEGPAALALKTASALADADGVDLISSEPPTVVGDVVELDVELEGTFDAVTDAVARLRKGLSDGASISIADHEP